MPRPPTLKIADVFASVQGEGLRQGEPTLFVRTAGCDLRCRFCDTKDAWRGETALPVAEIVRRLSRLRKRFPADWVCLTGGEPLLQAVGPLVRALKSAGLRVQVETNGRRFRALDADWITVSPKPPSYAVRREYRRSAAEVKLVVSRELTFDVLLRLRRLFPEKTPIILQPESRQARSKARGMRILESGLRAGLKNVRLMAQAHKELGLR
jgi:organic radical activating enzyme